MNKVKYRAMTNDDVERVWGIEQDIFATPWSKKSFYSEINENNIAHYIVATIDKKICGYGGLWQIINEMHITNIAVDREHRGCGIGKGILCEILDMAQNDELVTSITLEVRRSNFAAQSLYRKYGFAVVGVREKYYEDNREDAYIMWKKNI